MFKIVLIDSDKKFQSQLDERLQERLNCEISSCRSEEECTSLLKSDPLISLIVLGGMPRDGDGIIICEYLKKEALSIPIYFCSKDDSSFYNEIFAFNPKNRFFDNEFHLDELLETIGEIDSTILKGTIENYCKVVSSRFALTNNLPCDLFIKLSSTKYVKLIAKDVLYDSEFIDKYRRKGINHFYVHKKDFEEMDHFFCNLMKLSLSPKSGSSAMKIRNQYQSFRIVKEHIDHLGISEEVVDMVDKVVDSAIDTLRKEKEIFNLLNMALKKEGYLAEHSLMIAYVAGAIAMKMNWSTKATLKKISLAALLHDLSLDTPRQALVQTLEEINIDEFPPDSLQKIKNHPFKAREYTLNMKDIAPNIDDIVWGHHELPDASGFPRQLTARKTSPLTCLFIIAEDFVNHVYLKGTALSKEEMEAIHNRFKEKYDVGNYRNSLKGFLQLTGI